MNRRIPIIIWFVAISVIFYSANIYYNYVSINPRIPNYIPNPRRGYTEFGLILGILSLFGIFLSLFYFFKKRNFQEVIPGTIQNWLHFHVAVAITSGVLFYLHSGGNVNFRSGTYVGVALFIALATGLFGYFQYQRIPAKISKDREVENVASIQTERKIKELSDVIERESLGRSKELTQYLNYILGKSKTYDDKISLTVDENTKFKEIEKLITNRIALENILKKQRKYSKQLRGWLWLHIPASILIVPFLLFHIYATVIEEDHFDLNLNSNNIIPSSFQNPLECAKCHETQFKEWVSSMHAIAQMSPVTDYQHRLVALKEEKERIRLGSDAHNKVAVGDLCVRCHAPTGYASSDTKNDEPILAHYEDREDASRFGVSCVTCHQIKQIHQSKKEGDKVLAGTLSGSTEGRVKRQESRNWFDYECPSVSNKDLDRVYRNSDNLHYDTGRIVFSSLNGNVKSVGNDHHQSKQATNQKDVITFKDPSFCASCHTVSVDNELFNDNDNVKTPKTNFLLQDTFCEWVYGDEKKKDTKTSKFIDLNWSDDSDSGKGTCMQCHSMPLDRIVNRIETDEFKSNTLEQQILEVGGMIRSNLLDVEDTYAAENYNYDSTLPKYRKRYQHTFTGVDYHLSANMPLLKKDKKYLSKLGIVSLSNESIKEENFQRVTNLLKIAASLKITGVNRNKESLEIDIANLATGHHLPAGFAFAREMWIEVSTKLYNSDNWEVIIGGKNGKSLNDSEILDNEEPGLFNFQAVLFNRNGRSKDEQEVVLQNEATEVLKGKKARDAGFKDRRNFLLPGEIRNLSIPLPKKFIDTRKYEYKAKLRFRNYPPEFIRKIGQGYEVLDDCEVSFINNDILSLNNSGCDDNTLIKDKYLNNIDKLIENLKIIEMAEDTYKEY